MSIESAREYIQRLRKDPDLFKQATELKTKEERMAWVKTLGYDFTNEEVKQAFDELSQSGGLTEAELEMVAGGSCCGHTCESESCEAQICPDLYGG